MNYLNVQNSGMLHLGLAPFSPFRFWMQDMCQKNNEGWRLKFLKSIFLLKKQHSPPIFSYSRDLIFFSSPHSSSPSLVTDLYLFSPLLSSPQQHFSAIGQPRFDTWQTNFWKKKKLLNLLNLINKQHPVKYFAKLLTFHKFL